MKYTTAFVALFATLAMAAPTPTAEPVAVADVDYVVETVDETSDIAERAAKGTAILQFEIDNDTFTSNTQINVPGSLSFQGRQKPFKIIAAAVATAQGVKAADVRCQAFNTAGGKIGRAFGDENPVDLNGGKKVEVARIDCRLK